MGGERGIAYYLSSLCLCYLTVECSTFEMSETRRGSPSFYYTVRRFLRERIGGGSLCYSEECGEGRL